MLLCVEINLEKINRNIVKENIF